MLFSNGIFSLPAQITSLTVTQYELLASQYGSVKGERAKGKGFKYIQIPLPLNLFPDHKGSSYCLSEPYWLASLILPQRIFTSLSLKLRSALWATLGNHW